MDTETLVQVMIHITDTENTSHTLAWDEDQSLMEAMRDSGLPILASCGGCCSCATCHVHIAEQWRDKLPPISQDERDLLSETGAFDEASSRLSCQIPYSAALNGMLVKIAPDD